MGRLPVGGRARQCLREGPNPYGMKRAVYDIAGTPVAPDVCCVAPRATPARSFRTQRVADEIKAARRVVLVGGGPSGVETAAEIVSAFAGKQVTLVHGGERLLPALPPKAGAKARAWLEAHGVQVGTNI